MSALILLDLETTGLNEQSGEILELAMVALEYGSLRELAAVSTCLSVSSGFMSQLDEKAWATHTASGLLDELRGPRSHLRFEAGGWPNCQQAEAAAIGWMNQWGGQRSPLGGYNPEFDRRWLRKHMPRLEQNFHYRAFDINFCHYLAEIISVRRMGDKGCRHRALDDCRHAADTLRSFLRTE